MKHILFLSTLRSFVWSGIGNAGTLEGTTGSGCAKNQRDAIPSLENPMVEFTDRKMIG